MRGKKEEETQQEPQNEKMSIRKSSNGYPIPVKYENAELWYNPETGKYFMTVRFGLKKLTLEEIE
jgi:hypothetical protein